jgi:predicted DNA-binding protein YlxM (UPF0122 family)
MNKHEKKLLIQRIYLWIMANDDYGLGEAAEALEQAKQIVFEFEQDIKHVNK